MMTTMIMTSEWMRRTRDGNEQEFPQFLGGDDDALSAIIIIA